MDSVYTYGGDSNQDLMANIDQTQEKPIQRITLRDYLQKQSGGTKVSSNYQSAERQDKKDCFENVNRDLATVHLVHELKNLGFLGQEVDPDVRDSYQCLKLENKLIKSMAKNRDPDVHL